MSAVTKKLSLTLLAFAVILGITLPALSYADTTTDICLLYTSRCV